MPHQEQQKPTVLSLDRLGALKHQINTSKDQNGTLLVYYTQDPSKMAEEFKQAAQGELGGTKVVVADVNKEGRFLLGKFNNLPAIEVYQGGKCVRRLQGHSAPTNAKGIVAALNS